MLRPLICTAGLAFLLAGCSLPYHHRWKKSAQSTTATTPTSLEGAWQGTWRSEGTGHHGRLRAIVTPAPGKENTWQFHYRATWAKILSGGYRTDHKAIQTAPGQYKISGEHDLGPLFGGVFHYDGEATPQTFRANYRSNHDHGVFEMKRP